jgi:hypothetical protein
LSYIDDVLRIRSDAQAWQLLGITRILESPWHLFDRCADSLDLRYELLGQLVCQMRELLSDVRAPKQPAIIDPGEREAKILDWNRRQIIERFNIGSDQGGPPRFDRTRRAGGPH